LSEFDRPQLEMKAGLKKRKITRARFERLRIERLNNCASQITHMYTTQKKKNQRRESSKFQPVKNRGQTLFQPVKQTKGQFMHRSISRTLKTYSPYFLLYSFIIYEYDYGRKKYINNIVNTLIPKTLTSLN